MSSRRWIFRLQDIISAAQKVEKYINGMEFDDFLKDEKTADAVIRQLTIIGEAAAHVPEKITSLSPEVPWLSIRGMRNIMVHEYFGVNMQILWYTAKKNLPEMRFHLEELLDRLAKQQ